MKHLATGHRQGTLLQAAILGAIILGAGVAVVMVLLYRDDVHRAQRDEHHAQVGEYTLCLQREAYDRRAHELEQADADLMRQMIDADTANPVFGASARAARRAAFNTKLAKDMSYLSTPIVDGCELVKP